MILDAAAMLSLSLILRKDLLLEPGCRSFGYKEIVAAAEVIPEIS
jgi:hypothetical protein